MAYSFLAPGPIAFAHRGGSKEAPENTLAAFDAAYKLGFRYFETDVQVTNDGVVVAFHDPTLDRVTDRFGTVADMTIAEVEEADAGYWFTTGNGATYPFRNKGQRIPRLAHLLAEFPHAFINIDPKNDRAIVPLLQLLEEADAYDRVCIGSFSDRRLAVIRRLSHGRACTSMGPQAVAKVRIGSWLGIAPRSRADCVQVPIRSSGIRLIDQAFISACHRNGLPVHVWTVDEPSEIDRLLDLGVDGIMSDKPHALAEVFEARNLPLNGNSSSQ